MLRDPKLAQEMRHRIDRVVNPEILQDVFDGQHYINLLEQSVTWKGRIIQPPQRYFECESDVALGFGTDGIAPLSRGMEDFWPLLVTVFNLPPGLRTQREYQICCGLIPGT